jgi:hypothetical protein
MAGVIEPNKMRWPLNIMETTEIGTTPESPLKTSYPRKSFSSQCLSVNTSSGPLLLVAGRDDGPIDGFEQFSDLWPVRRVFTAMREKDVTFTID